MMRSARLRLPSNINLLVKRATLRLLYFASGTSGRRTTLLRLGKVRLLSILLEPDRSLFRSKSLLDYTRPIAPDETISRHQKRRRFDWGATPQSLSDAYARMPFLLTVLAYLNIGKPGAHPTITNSCKSLETFRAPTPLTR